MKKLALIIALVSVYITNAQNISYAAKAGLNYGITKSSNTDYNNKFDPILATHFGVATEFFISDVFAIQPEILFSTSGSQRKGTETILLVATDYDVKSTVRYLTVPVMAKYYFTNELSLDAGLSIGFLMAAKIDGNIKIGDRVVTDYDNKDIKDKYQDTDIGLGFGASYKMESGLFVSTRYNLGLTDIQAEESNNDTTLKNNVFQFSVGFFFM